MTSPQLDLLAPVPASEGDVRQQAGGPDRRRRRGIHSTSLAAWEHQQPTLTEKQAVVLELFQQLGPMTDRHLEETFRLRDWGPSTARKRRGELVARGLLEATGEKRDGLKVWRIRAGESA